MLFITILVVLFCIMCLGMLFYSNDDTEEDNTQKKKCVLKNDGRSTCYDCGAPTIDRHTMQACHQVCTNCGK